MKRAVEGQIGVDLGLELEWWLPLEQLMKRCNFVYDSVHGIRDKSGGRTAISSEKSNSTHLAQSPRFRSRAPLGCHLDVLGFA